MKTRNAIALFILILCGLILSACGNQTISAEKVEPISLELIDGSDRNKLVLTEHASQRLDIQTSPVTEASMSGNSYLVVPYSTIIYDLNGEVWVYINPTPLTYYREKVVVETIQGDSVFLTDGPPLGTMIVTTGVAELYGADTGVGK